jgi:hypothetical protein
MGYFVKNSIVPPHEVDALKDMIYKRARERAQLLANEVQNSYTTSFHDEIMISARESLSSVKNPFLTKVENNNIEKPNETNIVERNEIESAKKNVEDIKTQIHKKNNEERNNIAENTIQAVMDNARVNLSNKQSFIGALNFLNSQASIVLIKKNCINFEATA